MQVPIHKILVKMEEEIKQANLANHESRVREHLLVIRSLCELVLEEGNGNERPKQPNSFTQQPPVSVTSQSVKLKEDDGNGDSIFDFLALADIKTTIHTLTSIVKK